MPGMMFCWCEYPVLAHLLGRTTLRDLPTPLHNNLQPFASLIECDVTIAPQKSVQKFSQLLTPGDSNGVLKYVRSQHDSENVCVSFSERTSSIHKQILANLQIAKARWTSKFKSSTFSGMPINPPSENVKKMSCERWSWTTKTQKSGQSLHTKSYWLKFLNV